ncbi:MAG: sigma-54 interaction domain-containing protein [Planctomycetota bacterium]
MRSWESLLLEVWREACRHIELVGAVEAIGHILRRRLPLAALLVREIHSDEPAAVDTLVARPLINHCRLPEARVQVTQQELDALKHWCEQGEIASFAPARADPNDSLSRLLFPRGLEAEALSGPLTPKSGRQGLLVLVAERETKLQPAHRELAQRLLEPFSVALGNFEQLRELAALREAAEADRRSLLARLGRKELGDTIVGADSGLRAVMERVELVARSDAPVLVFGETGSGKELVARAIHTRSHRSDRPFIRVNCGAIPPELIDSQLFGHERGAFTGAVESRMGWFERADGGTLLLDEIGELPPAAQVRLLRIFQDGWLDRVGGQEPIHVDVRIVAATHRDLAEMVATGRFREDLWYRIAVFPIVLPPLRERRADIPSLAQHFAGKAAVRFGLAAATLSQGDEQLLMEYDWPGNVRELAAVIDRAAILGEGRRLEVAKALGVAPRPGRATTEPSARREPAFQETVNVLPLDVALRQHIEAALRTTDGRIEGHRGAARLLAVNPHTLRAKMRKLKIEWQRFRPQR